MFSLPVSYQTYATHSDVEQMPDCLIESENQGLPFGQWIGQSKKLVVGVEDVFFA